MGVSDFVEGVEGPDGVCLVFKNTCTVRKHRKMWESSLKESKVSGHFGKWRRLNNVSKSFFTHKNKPYQKLWHLLSNVLSHGL